MSDIIRNTFDCETDTLPTKSVGPTEYFENGGLSSVTNHHAHENRDFVDNAIFCDRPSSPVHDFADPPEAWGEDLIDHLLGE